MYYWEALEKQSEIEKQLEEIPSAEMLKINIKGIENPRDLHMVTVQNRLVAIVGNNYQLVQHKDVFKPIVNALHETGEEFDMKLWHNDKKASLSILTTETKDGIRLGFSATNSVNGKSSIKYSFSNFHTTRYIEIVGYRKVCSNGMLMRVPLDNAEIIRSEQQEKIEILLEKHARIIHLGKAKELVEEIEEIVEAMSMLKEPVALMIQKAENRKLAETEVDTILKKYIGKRHVEKIKEQYNKEKPTLWSLYNSLTFVGSHDEDLKASSRNGLIKHAAEMLTAEI